jgi:hypothetical protein
MRIGGRGEEEEGRRRRLVGRRGGGGGWLGNEWRWLVGQIGFTRLLYLG